MKKFLLVLSIVLAGLFLTACQDEATNEDLQAAYDTLSGVISSPQGITENFNLPTDLINDVTAVWESDQPGVISIGVPSDGVAIATVNRPAFGQDDASVELTATLTMEGSDPMTYTITLTVLASAAAELDIENIEDILAITDPAYDPQDAAEKTQVDLSGVTVVAKGDDSAFVYDGTGVLQVYGGASTDMVVGEVYDVSGTLEWYYGLWELTGSTASASTADAQMPTQEVFTSVLDTITAFKSDNLDDPSRGTVEDGNMEPIYAQVTGMVHVIPGDTSNYNTWIVDTNETDPATAIQGDATTPANAFMVYYHTNDFGTLRLYNGQVVTIDVVIHTYRSNNNAFALYYVGGEDGVVAANLTDADKQQIDLNAAGIPERVDQRTRLDFSSTGAIFGSDITWSYTDAEHENNHYVNLITGIVDVPEDIQVEAYITATVSLGDATDLVVNFELKLGNYPLYDISDVKDLEDGETVRVIGFLNGGYTTSYYFMQDATGGIGLYPQSSATGLRDMFADDLAYGMEIEVVGTIVSFRGYQELAIYQLNHVTVLDDEVNMPEAMALESTVAFTAEGLADYDGMLVSLSDFVLTDVSADSYGSYYFELTDPVNGRQIDGYFDNRSFGYDDALTALEALVANDVVNVTALVNVNGGTPRLMFFDAGQLVATGAELTDAQKVVLDSVAIDVPGTASDDLTLPTSGSNGSTISWATTHASLIATDGTFTAPTENTDVTLTATITLNEASTTADFVVIALAPITEELFFSEYIEGSGYNKAVEIYNPTSETVDLSGYRFINNYNGNVITSGSNILELSGMLPAGGTLVIYYSSEPASELVTAAETADVTIANSSNALNFNGDDALELQKQVGTDWVTLDIIGEIGVDPGSSWTANDVSTVNMTLTRNSSITLGVMVNPDEFDPSVEWTAEAQDTFSGLGNHTVE